MRTLFLDLASHQGLLACIEGGRIIGSRPVDHRIRDDELQPIFEGLLGEVKWGMKDIGRIASVAGPGGFTSLRVAAAFTNALAYALGVPVAGIHLSDLYAARQIPSPKSQSSSLWLHSTKKNEVFVREEGKEPQWMKLDEFLAELPEGASWMGELIPEHEAEVTKKNAKRAELQSLESILPSFADSLVYEKKTLEPWYGRKW